MLSFCYPPRPFPGPRVFYRINIDRRVLFGYECRTLLSLVVVLLPSVLPSAPLSLAHVGIVDFCVHRYFTDRLQTGEIWRIVVGYYRSDFRTVTLVLATFCLYSVLYCFLAPVCLTTKGEQVCWWCALWNTGRVSLLVCCIT